MLSRLAPFLTPLRGLPLFAARRAVFYTPCLGVQFVAPYHAVVRRATLPPTISGCLLKAGNKVHRVTPDVIKLESIKRYSTTPCTWGKLHTHSSPVAAWSFGFAYTDVADAYFKDQLSDSHRQIIREWESNFSNTSHFSLPSRINWAFVDGCPNIHLIEVCAQSHLYLVAHLEPERFVVVGFGVLDLSWV